MFIDYEKLNLKAIFVTGRWSSFFAFDVELETLVEFVESKGLPVSGIMKVSLEHFQPHAILYQ